RKIIIKNNIRVQPVPTRQQFREFVRLPRDLYKNDPLWVPPLNILESLDHKKGNNPVLDRSEHCMLLAYKEFKPVGRIISYIDPRFNQYYQSKTGMFGSFECIDDQDVAAALFSAADEWLLERGMTDIRGPINPVAESWGFLLEGNTSPVYMSPHNPLYYNDFIELSGFSKAKDLLVYEVDAGKGYGLPERFLSFDKKILEKRKNLTVRNINKRELKSEALHILNILNAAVADNWGFVPVEEDEMISIVKTLKLILDEKAILFVEDEGVPVAVALGFPDINVIFKKIKGRLNPFTIYRLIHERKNIKDYRLWGLAVLPEYHGQGLDVLLYVQLYKALEPKNIRLEANYMLEDNLKILNALEKMNLTQIKKYRVYQKALV
ncbi:hypothetical protein, partial [Oceanispirochaeta sp.]|uniref:hypothetical protein n=1 Tax=Oceanispirochaeta sp. TaxID=2035350 RepID=UPI0026096444